jgi:RNA-binding protein YhbY
MVILRTDAILFVAVMQESGLKPIEYIGYRLILARALALK